MNLYYYVANLGLRPNSGAIKIGRALASPVRAVKTRYRESIRDNKIRLGVEALQDLTFLLIEGRHS